MSKKPNKVLIFFALLIFLLIVGGIYIYRAELLQLSFFQNSPIMRSVGCMISGGRMQSGSAESGNQCILSYIDGGRSCTNSSQCLGGCVTDKPENLGKKGICRPTNSKQGCLTEITESKIWCLRDDIMMPLGY